MVLGDEMKKILTVLLLIFAMGCGRKEIYIPVEYEKPDINMLVSFPYLSCGRSMIAELPSGETLLIDCGGSDDFPVLYDTLRQMEMTRLDYIVLTSYDEDKGNALKKISANMEIGDIYISRMSDGIEELKGICKSNSYPDSCLYLVSEGTRLYDSGKVSIDVVYSGQCETKNGISSVISLYICCDDVGIFYEGDGDYVAEREIASTMNNLIKSDVIVVPHCGADYLPSDEIITAVNPKYAVIPVYGDVYPMDDTLKRLKNSGCEILRTDYDGEISLVTDGKEVDVYKER